MVSLMDTAQEQQHSSQPALQDSIENMNNDVIKEVGRQFVVQYYTVMNKCPQFLHRFYKDDSMLVRGGDGPVSGQVNIHDTFMKLGLEDCRAVVLQLDALKSHKNSLVIQVSGEISNGGREMRRFMQTFILVAKDAANFYVLNDIFHYQDVVYNDDVRPNGEEIHESDATTIKQDPGVIASYDNNFQGDVENVGEIKLNGEVDDKIVPSIPTNASSGVMEDTVSYGQHSQREVEMPESEFGRCPDVNGQTDEFETPDEEFDNNSQGKEEMDIQQEEEDFDSGSISQQPQEPTKPEGPRTWASLLGRDNGSSVQANPPRGLAKQPPVRPSVNKTSDYVAKSLPSDTVVQPSEQKSSVRPATNSGDSARPGAMAGQRGVNDSCQVFVGNLPHNITEDELRSFFAKFGQVQDVRINRNQKSAKGNLPDFGFVVFDNPKAVKDAVAQKPLYLNKHRINVEEKKIQKEGGSRGYNSGRGGAGRSSTSANRGGVRY